MWVIRELPLQRSRGLVTPVTEGLTALDVCPIASTEPGIGYPGDEHDRALLDADVTASTEPGIGYPGDELAQVGQPVVPALQRSRGLVTPVTGYRPRALHAQACFNGAGDWLPR